MMSPEMGGQCFPCRSDRSWGRASAPLNERSAKETVESHCIFAVYSSKSECWKVVLSYEFFEGTLGNIFILLLV